MKFKEIFKKWYFYVAWGISALPMTIRFITDDIEQLPSEFIGIIIGSFLSTILLALVVWLIYRLVSKDKKK